MRVPATFAAIALLAALPATAGERLALRVSPAMSFAPANLIAHVTIAADTDNRAVELIAESSEFYRSSEIALDGTNAPHVNVFEFRSLPSGEYEVRAVLKGTGNQTRAVTREQVRVIASGAGS